MTLWGMIQLNVSFIIYCTENRAYYSSIAGRRQVDVFDQTLPVDEKVSCRKAGCGITLFVVDSTDSFVTID
jgi:hypothetical protein